VPGAGCAATAPNAADVATLLEMNCRREMRRCFIVIPSKRAPCSRKWPILIEYA
jgi:hypothetical protein